MPAHFQAHCYRYVFSPTYLVNCQLTSPSESPKRTPPSVAVKRVVIDISDDSSSSEEELDASLQPTPPKASVNRVVIDISDDLSSSEDESDDVPQMRDVPRMREVPQIRDVPQMRVMRPQQSTVRCSPLLGQPSSLLTSLLDIGLRLFRL